MIADKINNEKLSPVVSELFARSSKLYIYIHQIFSRNDMVLRRVYLSVIYMGQWRRKCAVFFNIQTTTTEWF